MRRSLLGICLVILAASPAYGGDSYVLPDGVSRAPATTLHCATTGMNAAPCGTLASPVLVTSQVVGGPTPGGVSLVGTTPIIVLAGTSSISTRRYFFHIWNFGSVNLYCTDDGTTIPSTSSASFIVYGNGGGYEKDAPAFVSNRALNCMVATGSVNIHVESLP